MRSIANELNTLRNNKKLLKQAIIDKGQKLADGDRFDTYPIRIDNISIGNKIFKTIDEMNAWTKADIGDIAVVYDEDTLDFQGVYEYTDKGYVLTKNQFTTKPEYVLEGTFYGPNGIETGAMAEFKPSDIYDFLKLYDKLATSIKIDGNYTLRNSTYSRNLPPKLEITSNCTKCREMFYYNTVSELDLSNSDTSNVTDMYNMFADCKSLTNLDLTNFNTKSVTSMNGTFRNCTVLPNIDVSNWNTENVTDMQYMFSSCKQLTSIDVSNWNVQKVKDMKGMFNGCKQLTTIDVSNWDTQSITNISTMFAGCSCLENIDVSNWNTSNITKMPQAFSGCSSLTSLDLSNWDVGKVNSMYGLFTYCENLININGISNWNISNVTSLNELFNNCKKLKELDVSNWNTSNVTSMYYMFRECSLLKTLNLLSFNTERVTTMCDMFADCTSLENLDISNFNLGAVTNTSGMFRNCTKLTDNSLNCILSVLPTATSLSASNKTLNYLGLSSAQATTCTTLSNWEACVNAGWTTGY